MQVRVFYYRHHRGMDEHGNPTSVRDGVVDERRDQATVEVETTGKAALKAAVEEATGDVVLRIDTFEKV